MLNTNQKAELWRATVPLWIAAAAYAGGCAAGERPMVTSEMGTAQIREVLAGNAKPGMTLDQVNAGLDALHIANMRRRAYAGNPDQLLVRIAPVTGFWVGDPYEEFRYVDAWFVFSAERKYEHVDLEEKRMRWQAGEWLDPPFWSPDVLPNKPREVPGK